MVDTLLADHGLYHLEADLRWIDHTAARLDILAAEVPVATECTARSSRPASVVKSFGPDARAARRHASRWQQGEILAVMGPSGSGKSTLLHCLAGILAPDAGRSGSAASALDTLGETQRSALRRDRFGFVFQSGQLVPELTAEENVALPLLLGGTRRGRPLAEARAWFGRLGLDGLEQRRSGELSGGQAQRVALARGLVAEPEVLFADEPTGSLDSLTGEQVMNLLTAAAREQGTTVILVTHEARVAAYADREVIVRDGKVSSLHRARRRDPPRPAPDPQRRPGGRRPPGHPRGRRGARRRPAADHPGRRSTR